MRNEHKITPKVSGKVCKKKSARITKESFLRQNLNFPKKRPIFHTQYWTYP